MANHITTDQDMWTRLDSFKEEVLNKIKENINELIKLEKGPQTKVKKPIKLQL